MDEQLSELVKTGIYTAGATIGAIGVAYSIVRHWYLKRKSDNDTQAERTKAFLELLDSPNFHRHIEERERYVNSILQGYGWSPALRQSINTAIGKLEMPRLDK